MSSPNAGWYPDPTNPVGTRYWDGTRWTEHTGGPAGPAAPVPPPPSGGSAAGVVIAIIAALVLLAGGAVALVLIARDGDGTDAPRTTEAPATPTTAPSANEPGSPTEPGVSAEVLADCNVEMATMRTAVEAARVASLSSGIVETPDDYLNDPSEFEYFTWTGDTPETYEVAPIGTPPC